MTKLVLVTPASEDLSEEVKTAIKEFEFYLSSLEQEVILEQNEIIIPKPPRR